VTPAEWFDQFPPNPAMDGHAQWCARHWAPCPVLGANGIGAATELMSIFVNEVAAPNAKSADAMNREMEKAGRLCCTLGDERMYEIWGHWPPSAGSGEDG
jgi:hypothetical protein